MSRLTENDVFELDKQIKAYDKYLTEVCGRGLLGIAAFANGRDPDFALGELSKLHAACVPITAGLGIIGGFCDAVAAILRHTGVKATVTDATDVLGISEAVAAKYDFVFTADDLTFSAIRPANQTVSDNGDATGRGFAAALALAAGGAAGKNAVVLGAGPVGTSAAAYLHKVGANVQIYDILTAKAEALASALPGARVSASLESALAECPLVIEATPAPSFIRLDMLRPDTIISAPGVPSGCDPECLEALRSDRRIIADVLQIGAATMLLQVL